MSKPVQHLKVRKIAKRNLTRFNRLIAADYRRFRKLGEPIAYEQSDGARCGIGIAMKPSTLEVLSTSDNMFESVHSLQGEGVVTFDNLLIAELIQVAHDLYVERKGWEDVPSELQSSLDHYPLPIKYFFEKRGFDAITKRSYKKLMRIIREVA